MKRGHRLRGEAKDIRDFTSLGKNEKGTIVILGYVEKSLGAHYYNKKAHTQWLNLVMN